MINGEISITGVENQVSMEDCYDGEYEVRIGNAPCVNISKEQALNLKVALENMLPDKVTIQNRLPVFALRG